MRLPRALTSAMRCGIGIGYLAVAIAAGDVSAEPSAVEKKLLERGRYLAIVAGCNDCHTAGYADAAGKVPEKDWLMGDRIGWRGPWGTTYSSNLRLAMQRLTEEQWLHVARTVEFRPPMPWYVLREMTEQDLRAIYRFIKSLGPAGEPTPAFVPPDQEPPKPYILFPDAP